MAKKKELSKIEALAKFLDVSVDDLSEERDENTFSLGSKEYLVLTDEEADEMTEEVIERDLWAFNASWLESHTGMDKKAIAAIQGELYEDASPHLKKLIKDWDHFVSDSVLADGRGHFLAGYDHEENEEGDYFIYRTN